LIVAHAKATEEYIKGQVGSVFRVRDLSRSSTSRFIASGFEDTAINREVKLRDESRTLNLTLRVFTDLASLVL